MDTYILEYSTFKQNGDSIKYWGVIKIKNCDSELHAKIRLEEYLKKQNPKVDKLVVHSCRKEYGDDVFDLLNTIMGGKR